MKQASHPHTTMPLARQGTPEPDLWRDLPVGVIQLGTDYRLVRANAIACQCLTTLGMAAILGEPILNLGGTPIQTLLVPRPGGPPHEVVLADLPNQVWTIRAQPLPKADAEGWVLLIQDVTAERHQQRQQAQQERLAAMQRLVAGVANAFHQTLCSMVGYAELLRLQGEHPQALQDDLATIVTWGQRGLKLARHMLDFSGQSVTRLHLRDLQLILKKLLHHLERTLPPTIHMGLERAQGTYLVNVDVALCLQLLFHLTLNARDAMPEGGELCFALSHVILCPDEPPPCPHMPPGEWVKLTVRDTGQGMSPEVQARLFDPFFTTQTGRRTGLGLAQVHRIMKQHDGYITVASEVGQGSVFSLYFPSRSRSAEAMLAARPEDMPRGRGRDPVGGGP